MLDIGEQSRGGPSDDVIERQVTEIWKRNLLIADTRNDAHFLDEGGDSLAATLIALDLEATFSIEFSLGDLYASPTISSITAHVAQKLSRIS